MSRKPNDNVLFEVGFAIGAQRRLWLVRDDTLEEANAWWRQFGILAPYEFSRFTNAGMLVVEFWKAVPHEGATFFDEEIAAHLTPGDERSLAYLRSPVDTEAEIKIAPRILAEKTRGLRVSILDPAESANRLAVVVRGEDLRINSGESLTSSPLAVWERKFTTIGPRY